MHPRAAQHGATLVEFAIVVPILLFMLLILIQYGLTCCHPPKGALTEAVKTLFLVV